MIKSTQNITELVKSPIFVNSSWGIISQVLQSILLSLFFILIARNYTTLVFANFIIATVLYQLIAAFSSLGLSQWFIRELANTVNKKDLINKFLKLQIYSGIAFYIANILLGFCLYNNHIIHVLIILLGINIVFDNLINAIKCVNISEFNQKKSFIILSIDAFLKFAVTCILFVYPISIITLSIMLITVRFTTLNLFINIGSSRLINLKLVFKYKISFKYIKELLISNWPFIIIGSVSIINWRIATIIISKVLTPIDVANYEISFRIFSLAIMLPVVISTTVFPTLITLFKEGKIKELTAFYKKVQFYSLLFGLFSFTFIYSFVDFLLPFLFGSNYSGTGIYTKQMFLTILVFPTAFLQANLLVAIKFEKLDMWFNVVNLISNVTFCLIGIYFIKSLSVINISIFIGFLIFHILQDVVLVKKDFSSRRHVFKFYTLNIFAIGSYLLLAKLLNPVILFSSYWISILCLNIYLKKIREFNEIKIFPKISV